MKQPVFPNKQAVALVLTLACIVLLVGLLTLFLEGSLAHQRVAVSGVASTRCDVFARGMLNQILGDLRAEIANGSTQETVNNVTLFSPTSTATAVPERIGTDDKLPNLIKVSRFQTPFFTNDTSQDLQIDRTSQIATTAPALEGRFIPMTRWNRPRLLPLGNADENGAEPDAAFVAPDWIYVARDGSNPKSWSDALKTRSSDSMVIGRYAFMIYDEGGLLDANVTGFPAPTSSKTSWLVASQTGGKGSVALADLTRIGMTQTQINRLVAWRNYASAQALDATPYFDAPGAQRFFNLLTSRMDGWLRAYPKIFQGRTDQRFTSRQRLLKFLATQLGSKPKAESVAFLGMASRSLNAPLIGSSRLANVRVKQAFMRVDGSQAKAGESLIANRFPLSRLLAINGSGLNASANTIVSGSLTAATAATVQRDFGLLWNAAEARWEYVGSQRANLQSKIESLDEVTSENREPNFFELLQAAVLQGSLGGEARDDTGKLPSQQQASKLFHLLTIGANLIAQAQPDSFPVRIAIRDASSGAAWEAVGSQQLPYLDRFAVRAISDGKSARVSWMLVPTLWNPYQAAGALPQNRPSIRMVIEGSVQPMAQLKSGEMVISGAMIHLQRSWLAIPNSVRDGCSTTGFLDPGAFANGEVPVFDADANGWRASPSNPSAIGFAVACDVNLPAKTLSGAHPFLRLSAEGQQPFQVVLEYQDANANWHAYSYLQGIDDSATWMRALDLQGCAAAWNASGRLTADWSVKGLNEVPVFVNADPRGARFNSVLGCGNPSSKAQLPWMAEPLWKTASPGGADGLTMAVSDVAALAPGYTHPKFFGNDTLFPARWSRNVSSGDGRGYADPDGIVRMGDSGLFANGDGKSGNPFTRDGDRPWVLNRAFRNVGEMSYAFRDQPMKSLDFFSSKSGDALLLDWFCANESPRLRAGDVNLNTRNAAVIAALLSGATLSESAGTTMVVSDAQLLAEQIVQRTKELPLQSRAELPALVTSLDFSGLKSPDAWKIKTQRESIVRALAEVGQTRTWNLLIDLIAQDGKFPPGAANLAQFSVAAERHYWLHVAIDRETCEVIDEQFERVDE